MTWETLTFRDLFTIKHGFAFKSESFANQGSFVVLTPGHFAEVGGFRHRNGSEKYYLGYFPKEYLLEEGSLLVAMTEQAPGLLGSPILIQEGNKYLHNQRFCLVQWIESSRVYKEFLYHLFNSHAVRKQINLTAGGTKVRHTSPAKILDVHIDLPSLPEQKKIVEILNCWDRVTAQTGKLIEAKQKLKKGLVQQLLTGKRRFKEFVKSKETRRTNGFALISPHCKSDSQFIYESLYCDLISRQIHGSSSAQITQRSTVAM